MSLEARIEKPYCTYCCREECICFAAPQVVREMLGAAHKVLSQVLTAGPLKAVIPDNSAPYLLAQARCRTPALRLADPDKIHQAACPCERCNSRRLPDQLHQRVPREFDPPQSAEKRLFSVVGRFTDLERLPDLHSEPLSPEIKSWVSKIVEGMSPRGSDDTPTMEKPRMETPKPSERREVRLVTADDSLVTQTDIPPFDPFPKVILWGDRVFVINSAGCDPLIYKEVFSYVLP